MSDEITYTTVRFQKTSSELQNRGRADETQGPREADHREWSVPWHLIAIPLGILCSILLVTVAMLVKHIFQYNQEKHELQKALNNLHQEYSTMQNASYLMEEMWKTKSVECDACKDHLVSLNRKQNYYGEINVVLDCKQLTGKRVEGHWFCAGIKCYYFITDEKHWSGCEQTCQNCSLSFLNIEDNDELKFLQLQIKPGSYWIGLSYNKEKSKWQWIGDSPSKLDLNTMKLNHNTGRCAFLSRARLENESCDKTYTCICEKRLDKFPDSFFSRN
ncbi:killer cell lectin-like receptor 2 [Onychomys torridus]|uniref:killer cell lectin-like receptor 2 n=1 Tax=Onychomys torridus TaxID=38674 RepID=UPI00167F375B|nr:killer cell lectin-like receptor 2 [Onychomys torridus]